MRKCIRFLFLAACVAIIASGVRLYAAEGLDIDYDEPVYLEAAIEYAGYIRSGKWNMLAWSETNYEHPPLFKILYGVVILPEPQLEKLHRWDFIMLSPMRVSNAIEYGMAARYLSVFFGTVTAVVLALVNPIAGLFLAINSLSVKYTSQIYLEALPLLTSFLSVFSYLEYLKLMNNPSSHKAKKYFYVGLSALLLGITAASKFIYCVAGLAIVAHFLISWARKQQSKRNWIVIIGWGAFSIVAFFIFNPYLWPHPWPRLEQTIAFHLDFPGTQTVIRYGYPFWQPLRWLINPFAYFDPRPQTAFLIQVDWLIFLMAIIGLYRSYRNQFMYFVWLVTALIVLLLW
ncbi:MAG TPA: hypothetical protein VLH16_04370, partial [Bacteroidales bacterium]|nr:hypothetical protein [Bacteroidales bacterium]